METNILPTMVQIRDFTTISSGDRLFYELGYKNNILDISYGSNWVRTGRFKEIEDVNDFLENDNLITDKEYLEHHNFMVIKKNKKDNGI